MPKIDIRAAVAAAGKPESSKPESSDVTPEDEKPVDDAAHVLPVGGDSEDAGEEEKPKKAAKKKKPAPKPEPEPEAEESEAEESEDEPLKSYRVQLKSPGNPEITVKAVDRLEAIEKYKEHCGILSTPHKFVVQQVK